jgi:hypothetical protein
MFPLPAAKETYSPEITNFFPPRIGISKSFYL